MYCIIEADGTVHYPQHLWTVWDYLDAIAAGYAATVKFIPDGL